MAVAKGKYMQLPYYINAYTLFFIRTSNFGAEAERSFFFFFMI